MLAAILESKKLGSNSGVTPGFFPQFRRLGERFLGHPIEDVKHVDLKE